MTLTLQSDSVVRSPRLMLGFSATDLIVARPEVVIAVDLSNRFGVSLNTGYDHFKRTRVRNLEKSNVRGPYVLLGLNCDLHASDNFALWMGVQGGLSWFTHDFVIRVPGYYRDYVESDRVQAGVSALSVSTGPKFRTSWGAIVLGATVNFWKAREDRLAAEANFYVPGVGSKLFPNSAGYSIQGLTTILWRIR